MATTPHTDAALKLATDHKANMWAIGRELMQAVDGKETTIRDFSIRLDGHADHEQRYAIWMNANRFYKAARVEHEEDLEVLWKAGLRDITFYAYAWRFFCKKATIQECVELLQECMYEDGIRGSRWMNAKITETVGEEPGTPEGLVKDIDKIFKRPQWGISERTWQIVTKLLQTAKRLIAAEVKQ